MNPFIFWSLFIVLLSGCEPKKSILPSGKKVIVNVIASQSGAQKAYGYQGLQGLKAAQSLYPLLPNGDEIIIKIHDDASHCEKSKAFIRAMDENVSALITFFNSDMQLCTTHVIEKLKLPTLSAIATHNEFTTKSQYLTRLSMSNSIEAEISASYIRDEMLLSRVGIVYSEESLFSRSLAEMFQENFSSIGGDVIAMMRIESLENSQEDLQRLLDTFDLDLIYFTTDAIQSHRFLQAFNKLDTEVKLFASDGLLSDMQKHYPKEMHILDGILLVEHYSNDMYKNGHALAFIEYFNNADLTINSFAGLGYEAYQFLYVALSMCPDYSRECINTKLRNSEPMEGLVSVMQSKDGNMQRPVYINEVKNSQMLRKVKVY